jgi:hypothetical protein
MQPVTGQAPPLTAEPGSTPKAPAAAATDTKLWPPALTFTAGSSLTNQRTDSSSLSLFQVTRFLGFRGFLSTAAAASATVAAAFQAAPDTAAATAPGTAAPSCRWPPKADPNPVRLSPGKRPWLAGGWATQSVTVTACSGVTASSTATRRDCPAAAEEPAAAAVPPAGGGDGRRGRCDGRSLAPAAAAGDLAADPANSFPASAVSTSCTPPVCRHRRKQGRPTQRHSPFQVTCTKALIGTSSWLKGLISQQATQASTHMSYLVCSIKMQAIHVVMQGRCM